MFEEQMPSQPEDIDGSEKKEVGATNQRITIKHEEHKDRTDQILDGYSSEEIKMIEDPFGILDTIPYSEGDSIEDIKEKISNTEKLIKGCEKNTTYHKMYILFQRMLEQRFIELKKLTNKEKEILIRKGKIEDINNQIIQLKNNIEGFNKSPKGNADIISKSYALIEKLEVEKDSLENKLNL